MMKHKAIFALYPQTVTIRGEEVFDAEGNLVNIDKDVVDSWVDPHAYKAQRAAEYPPIADYIDGVVKGDQAQINKYIADCLAVKEKYPK